jgi:hypothetical protein
MNKAMAGPCGVGIVIVDGPAGSTAAFTDAEKLDVALAFSHGFDALYTISDTYSPVRPHLLLLADIKTVTLTIDPTTIAAPNTLSPTNADYSSRETPWRDAALAALGYSAGAAGIRSYTTDLLAKTWSLPVTPTSAYVAFVTKYHAAWLAYTMGSQFYQVYQYPWVSAHGDFELAHAGGYGRDWHKVVAHETGHIFGAPDEYASSHCSSTQTFGALHVPNGNCENDTTVAHVQCLMSHNDIQLCNFTVQTFGWVDANADGVLDVAP